MLHISGLKKYSSPSFSMAKAENNFTQLPLFCTCIRIEWYENCLLFPSFSMNFHPVMCRYLSLLATEDYLSVLCYTLYLSTQPLAKTELEVL